MSPDDNRLRLSDFPIVYISFDEPWADETWAALKETRPDAHRVHGVKGLNACHVAAADAAGSEWFLTVDADTRLLPSALEVTFDKRLLLPHFRLDWQSRNPANGLISGNGSLKLWPEKLARNMRSHEAAPEEKISLDADIGDIEPGKSRLVQMAGCHSTSDPATTPYHAFRAGFRETVFLAWLLRGVADRDGSGSEPAQTLRRLIGIWCSLGAHHENGAWLIYGARLGLWALSAWPDWDVRDTTDYDWFKTFWHRRIAPRFDMRGVWKDTRWNADFLAAENLALGQRLAQREPDYEIADLSSEASAMFVRSNSLPTVRTAQNMDSLGTAFKRGRIVPEDREFAHAFYDVAALMQYPPAINNIARLHKLRQIPGADQQTAHQMLQQATALGDQHAPFHLAGLLLEERGKRDDEIEALFDLAASRGFAEHTAGSA